MSPDFAQFFILIVCLLTSTLSGVLGMGGGMILMVVLLHFLPVSEAMILHGLIQLISNGSRIGIHFKSIQWKLIGGYLLGSALTFMSFKLINFVPNKTLIYLIIGTIPLLSLIPKIAPLMSITQRGRNLLCAIGVTSAQLLAGTSGPILDIFFISSPLSRYSILGTKAVTQSLGHLIKVLFYGSLLSSAGEFISISLPLLALCLFLTLIGNILGSKIVAKMNDQNFKKFSRNFVYIVCIPVLLKAFFA